MAEITGLTQVSATLTQLNYKDPKRFEAATLVEIAEVGRQQAVTNELLTLNTQIAFQTNALMRGIREAVETLAISEGRERQLKELLYQMIKLLKADKKGESDPVELAFRSRLFLHTVGQYGLNTGDLSDLQEKAMFDKLLIRSKKCIEGDAHKDLEDFETVYAMYQGACEEDPAKALPQPEPPVISLPEEPYVEPLMESEPAKTLDAKLKTQQIFAWVGVAICGFALVKCVMHFWTNVVYASLWILVFGGGLYAAIKTLLTVRSIRQDPLRYEEAKRKHEQQQAEWKSKKEKWDADKAKVMAAHQERVEAVKRAFACQQDVYAKQLAQREERVQQACQQHQSLLDKMCGTINEFLDQHSGLQEFLPKVSPAVVKRS